MKPVDSPLDRLVAQGRVVPPSTDERPEQILTDRPDLNLSDIVASLRDEERY